MKKVLLLMFLAIMTLSCQVNDNVAVPASSVANTSQREDLSKIDELEANGVKLFKKDVKVSDPAGQNSVTLQLAFTDERSLTEYLENTQFTLHVFSNLADLPAHRAANPGTSTAGNSKLPVREMYEVITERNFVKGIVAYSVSHDFKVKSGSNGESTSGAKLAYTYGTWIESYVRDNFMDVTWLYSGNPGDGLYVECFYTNCGVCGWQTDPQTSLLNSVTTFFHYSHTGARRLSVRVNHNYYNYTVYWGTE